MGLLGPEGDALDRALVTCFPAPHSFTGDDTVEFSVHGGALVPGLVVAAALAAGARLATRASSRGARCSTASSTCCRPRRWAT